MDTRIRTHTHTNHETRVIKVPEQVSPQDKTYSHIYHKIVITHSSNTIWPGHLSGHWDLYRSINNRSGQMLHCYFMLYTNTQYTHATHAHTQHTHTTHAHIHTHNTHTNTRTQIHACMRTHSHTTHTHKLELCDTTSSLRITIP